MQRCARPPATAQTRPPPDTPTAGAQAAPKPNAPELAKRRAIGLGRRSDAGGARPAARGSRGSSRRRGARAPRTREGRERRIYSCAGGSVCCGTGRVGLASIRGLRAAPPRRHWRQRRRSSARIVPSKPTLHRCVSRVPARQARPPVALPPRPRPRSKRTPRVGPCAPKTGWKRSSSCDVTAAIQRPMRN